MNSCMEPRETPANRVLPKILVLGIFLVFSVWFGHEAWQGITPYTAIGGDSSNIASFAAARLTPENFAKDALLSDPGNFAFYRTFHTFAAYLTGRWFDDIGLAFAILNPITLFIFLSGFWLLFLRLGFRPISAMVAAVAMLVTVDALAGTYWGSFRDPQPRFLYSALLPFAVLALLSADIRSWRFVAVFAALGGLSYVHPVSGPPVAFALWCAAAASDKSIWTERSGLLWLIAAGLVFLAVISPFVVNYVSHVSLVSHAPMSGELHERFVRDSHRFYGFLMDVPRSLSDAFVRTWWGARLLFLAAAILLLAWGLRNGSAKSRRLARFALGFAAGLLVVSVLAPLLDYEAARLRDGLTRQLDLVRNTRYFIAVVLIICLYGAYYAVNRWSGSQLGGLAAVAVFAALWYGMNLDSWLRLLSPLERFEVAVTGRADSQADGYLEKARSDAALARFARQNTRPDAAFLFTHYWTLAERRSRVAGQRSVVYSKKDWSVLYYTNPRAFVDYVTFKDEVIERALAAKRPEDRYRIWLEVAGRLRPDYVVLTPELAKLAAQRGHTPLFETGPYAVFTARSLVERAKVSKSDNHDN